MELNLRANTPAEQKILEYLQNNASETLADKINNDTKSQTVLAFFCNERVGVVWKKRLLRVE